MNALKNELHNLGYIENRNIELQIRWDEGLRENNAAELALTVRTIIALAGKFFAVEAKRASILSDHSFREIVSFLDFQHFP